MNLSYKDMYYILNKFIKNTIYIICYKYRYIIYIFWIICYLYIIMYVLSHVWLFLTPWTVARQAPLSMEFPSKNTEAGCHFLLQQIYTHIHVCKCMGIGRLAWLVKANNVLCKNNFLKGKYAHVLLIKWKMKSFMASFLLSHEDVWSLDIE